jgi:hypothetical protein
MNNGKPEVPMKKMPNELKDARTGRGGIDFGSVSKEKALLASWLVKTSERFALSSSPAGGRGHEAGSWETIAREKRERFT